MSSSGLTMLTSIFGHRLKKGWALLYNTEGMRGFKTVFFGGGRWFGEEYSLVSLGGAFSLDSHHLLEMRNQEISGWCPTAMFHSQHRECKHLFQHLPTTYSSLSQLAKIESFISANKYCMFCVWNCALRAAVEIGKKRAWSQLLGSLSPGCLRLGVEQVF